MYIILAVILAFFTSASYGQTCESKLFISPRASAWVGCISQEAVKNFKEKMSPSVDTLIIQSEGGDVSAGIALAKEVHSRNLTVIVRGYCNSSCANYVLPAAKTVFVEPDSVILFHGDAKITLNRLAKLDWIDPMLLLKLARLSETEDELNVLIPKAERIQLAQRVALAAKGTLLTGRIQTAKYECHGIGLPFWVPATSVLTTLQIVESNTKKYSEFSKEVPFRVMDFGTDVTASLENPLDHCVIVEGSK